jgi:hypothetical protein
MTDERFWSLIEQAKAGQEASANPTALEGVLRSLSTDEVLEFGHLFHEKICDLNHWRLWGAGEVITGGMSDDAFHYFRTWIVGKGLTVFEIARREPDELGPYVDDADVDNECLAYVALEVLEARGIDEDPRDRSSRDGDGYPAGTPFEDERLAEQYPKLAALFS